ncbi:hypothetical protein ACQE98_14680 [Ornithinimicrobium sp. W1679]|uniref:hypothetical protein n=1 Tax=Ornithinimicrobium sp. W1679 TaxID=3418770 RepID=UPI003CE67537
MVVGIDRPSRPARRNGAKSDELDAVRAAREALSREHHAAPRARGDREALRVLLTARHGAVVGRTKAIGQLKALIVNAPQALRDQLRRGTTDEQLERCSRLRTSPAQSVEHRTTIRAARAVARRALFLEAEAAEHESDIEELVIDICPSLLDLPGVARSPRPSSSSPGPTPARSATRPRSPRSLGQRPSRPAAARPYGTG